MILFLALRNAAYRPWRTALLLAGYGLGVAVMIVLLSIGSALLLQARDERLIGGGDITVLPEGIDIEVLKTGGLGGMFFSIGNARFVQLQLLDSPRHAQLIDAVAPQIDWKLMYLRRGEEQFAVRATGEVPSANRAVGAGLELVAGVWEDDDADRSWVAPEPAELRHAIDHFHHTPPEIANRDSWGEWHYFNIMSDDGRSWAFISLLVGGDVPNGEWGGQVLVTLHQQGSLLTDSINGTPGRVRRFSSNFGRDAVQLSTTRADLRVGTSSVQVLPNGDYRLQARARGDEQGGGTDVVVDLTVTPSEGAYFPGASIGGGEFESGYAVAALRADGSGHVCVVPAGADAPANGQGCEQFRGAQAYHDHNWGVWQGVTWEWGAARAGELSLLYGRVEPPDADRAGRPLFVYVVDSLGFRALFRPANIEYSDFREVRVGGAAVSVPTRGRMVDVRGSDTLRVELTIEDVAVTDVRESAGETGQALSGRQLDRPYFLQMKGRVEVRGWVGGQEMRGEGRGHFESYVGG